MEKLVSGMIINQKVQQKLAITVTEMADMLSISRPFAYEILDREDFKGSFRIGTKRLISVDYLKEWIAKQIQEGDEN